jgi:RNA 2',3'-cyclic 3'-phosphodiesterase
MTTLRTFIAIELEQELKDQLCRVQDQLRAQGVARGVRWVQPEGIHLTLKFLGDTPLERIEEVKAALARAAAKVDPFSFSISGLGCFPNTRQPRVVWVGLQEPTGAMVRLRDAVEAQVAPLGFPTEHRAFSPHLTLGRVQRYTSKSEVRDIGQAVAASAIGVVGEMTARTVCYIQSDLKPSGAVYTTLFEAELKLG